MDKIEHTPGPWFQEGAEIKGADHRPIAKIHYEFTRYGDPARQMYLNEDRANARLLLAAPEMLKALRSALGWLEEIDKAYAVVSEIAELLRKVDEDKAVSVEEGK